MSDAERRRHVLPDVLEPGLDVVFVGTAAGRRSAELQAYYAGPGNRFWSTLFETRLTPIRLRPEEYERLPEFRLGLTDLAKHTSGADASLRRRDFCAESLREKLLQHRPGTVAFTSKRAAQEFLGEPVVCGLQTSTVDGISIFVLSSPSGRARGFWQNGKQWHALAEFVRDRYPGRSPCP